MGQRPTAYAGIAIAALTATLIAAPRPLLVWNASASSPIGLYRVGPASEAATGDLVIAWPPAQIRDFASKRGYLPANVPLVKRVAAASGDLVCAAGDAVQVNGKLAAWRVATDRSSRPLPWWKGCERLTGGDLFLLSAGVPTAFDGRYFGITRQSELVGKAKLLWRP